MIQLSLCIPTYNRAEYLSELLESIHIQLDENLDTSLIEVCVNDNASDDDTLSLLMKWEKRFKNFKYRINPYNQGADTNYQKVVELASGNFFWFLGSDDKLVQGSIKQVLEIIKNQSLGIVLFNRINCNRDMLPVHSVHWMKSSIQEYTVKFGDEEGLQDYLKNSNSLGAVFSYLSSIICKKELWQPLKFQFLNEFEGSAYSHVYILMSIFLDSGNKNYKLSYLNMHLIFNRGNNDAFLDSPKKRLFLDFVGYRLIIEKLKLQDKTKKELYSILRREHPYEKLVNSLTFYRIKRNELPIIIDNVYTSKEIKLLKFRSYLRHFYFPIFVFKRILEKLKILSN